MEKSSKRTKSSKFIGLLIFFSLILFSNQSIFAHYYSRYVFKPTEEYVFQGEETVFETTIPNLRPVDIQVTAQNLPDKVTFIASDKTEIFNEAGVRCTRVRIIYRFDEIGFFRMPPIASRIRYGAYTLTVANVNVLHNPQTIQPLVKFERMDDGKTVYSVGEKIPLMLTVSFASKIESFHATVLENSAICKVTDEFPLPVTIGSFTDEPFAVAQFNFIPLEEGIVQVPQVNVKVQTWKEVDKIVSSEPMEFFIKKVVPEKNTQIQDKPSVTTDKFNKKTEITLTEKEILARNEKIQKIAELRAAEKKHLFNSSYKKNRVALEQEIGISKTENELSFGNLYIFLFLFLVSVVTLIVSIVFKKKALIIIMTILAFLILIGVLIFTICAGKDYAILLEEKIYLVPEEISNIYFSLKPGTRVQVKGITTDWIFITYGENSAGWVKSENLILLK
ncbi:MAG: hypothetical protein SPI86_03415 [Treponemataceae bacterium]|nr:hypothetical protein [Spirochaetales bacterium]MDY6030794.1 hypothetical protein [Treponemataceae bacterium]